ncbi:hypothetical protein THASP1DRAFT_2677, partial [Thamnocephalis sphaerospora]
QANVYRHDGTGMRAVLLHVPGPLCYLTVVVPTGCKNNRGLPHTLEHLIFCGSAQHPRRGYLDTLACRSLSSGTNAYTAEDHTAYTLTTAGAEGMRSVLAVYLQHILAPTLRDEQFVTEVFHWDGNAKQQGVVYSEMAARENTSADLFDRHLRQMLYADSSTYYYECGGLTPEIMLLSNEQIRRYHRDFYQPSQLTLLLAGSGLDDSMLAAASAALDAFAPRHAVQSTDMDIERPLALCADYRTLTKPVNTRTVRFASVEEDVGEIGYGWHAPALSDVKTCVALQVLLRYFQETAASPLRQRFVERTQPWAAFVWYELEQYVRPYIVVAFGGVPCAELDLDLEAEADDTASGKHTAGDGGDPLDLLRHGPFYRALMDVLQTVAREGFPEADTMPSALRRHRKKLCEEIEYDPHDTFMTSLVHDVVAQAFLGSDHADAPSLGSRAQLFHVLDELEHEGDTYWLSLLRRWLINAPAVEVIMVPDATMASDIEEHTLKMQQKKRDELGDAGMAQLAVEVTRAVEANKVDVPPSVIQTMPDIPLVSNVPRLPFQARITQLDGRARPFTTAQLVDADTVFTHIQLGLPVAALPHQLRPYLLLFQSLLFQSSVRIPNAAEFAWMEREGISLGKVLDYRDVTRCLARDLVSHGASAGYGSQLAGTAWLPDLFMIMGAAERGSYNKMVTWLLGVLVGVQFEASRISTIVRNLLSDLGEIKREGSDMLEAVISRSTLSPLESGSQVAARAGSSGVTLNQNDLVVSLFRQQAFLKGVLARVESGSDGAQGVLDALEDLRKYLLTPQQATHDGSGCELDGFVQITTPSGAAGTPTRDDPCAAFLSVWDSLILSAPEMVRRTGARGPFPIPRVPYCPKLDASLVTPGSAVTLALPALTSSYVACILPCDVFGPVSDPSHPLHSDYFAVTLLCELLSRTEGPLYEAVRGKGYAYGAHIGIRPWCGQLVYSVGEAQDPANALRAFWAVLESMDSVWDEMCTPFAIDAARSTIAYQWFSDRSTAPNVIGAVL